MDAAVSLALLSPGLAPLYLVGLSLEMAPYLLGPIYVALAVCGLWVGSGPSVQGCRAWRPTGAEWAAAVAALVLLVPSVAAYAGGSVDDWWDLAFVRSYAHGSLSDLSAPLLGNGLSHPRFLWSAWLLLQSLVLAVADGDALALQSAVLAPAVCMLAVSAQAYLADSFFGREKRAAVVGAIVFVPVWLYGSEALPFFSRLYQDKFVAALVLMPVLLGMALRFLREGVDRRRAVLLALVSSALCMVHSLVYCIGLGGVVLCLAAWSWTRIRRRPGTSLQWGAVGGRVPAIAAAALLPLPFPIWQARALGERFAAQGIALAQTDNPVVSAHLWLGRLLWSEGPFYIVTPSAVFGLPALVAAAGVCLALWRLRSRSITAGEGGGREDERLGSVSLVLLSLVPCAIIFVPLLCGLAGRFLIPWMLYRIGWLVPLTVAAGLVVDRAWGLSTTRTRTMALAGLAALCLALSGPTGADRVARGMREHPFERETRPRGNTLAAFRALAEAGPDEVVLAPPRFSELVTAMSGLAVVAMSERGTLVFSASEAEAYTRLRDRADFFAEETSPAERGRIARRYGAGLAVFPRGYVTAGSESRLLDRYRSPSFLEVMAEEGAPWSARRETLMKALPEGGELIMENRDFFVLRLPLHGAEAGERGSREATEAGSWHSVFGLHADGEAGGGSEVLASISGYPGAEGGFRPRPFTVAYPLKPVWSGGSARWEDGPAETYIVLKLGSQCRPRYVEVVPFQHRFRREVLSVTVGNITRQALAGDAEVIRVPLAPATTDSLSIGVRSRLGRPFALADVRVLGDRSLCHPPWRPVAGDDWPPRRLEEALLRDVAGFPGSAASAMALAAALERDGSMADARAQLRLGLRRDPGQTNAWVQLGLLRDAAGRFSGHRGALAAYQKAVSLDGNNAWAAGCLAWARLRAGNLPAAFYNARRAMRLDPRYADAHTITALVQRRLGMDRAAERSLATAIDLDRRRSWAYLELARLYSARGDLSGAMDTLTTFLKLEPRDSDARRALEKLLRAKVFGMSR